MLITYIIVTADECEVQRVCHAGEEDVNLAEREHAVEAAKHQLVLGLAPASKRQCV